MSDHLTAPPGTITVVRLTNPSGHDPVSRVLSVIGRTNLTLADELHAGSQARPYSLVRRGLKLDVVCCGRDDLANALLSGDDLALIVVRRPLAELLVDDARRGRSIRLAFETPTAFRRSGLDHLGYEPETLFANLAHRWVALGGALPEAVGPRLREVPAWPATLSFRPATGGAGARLRGFVGVVSYDLLPLRDEVQAALWTLARFAEYRGVGRGTSYGLGRVRLLNWGEQWTEGQCRAVWDTHGRPVTAAGGASMTSGSSMPGSASGGPRSLPECWAAR